MLETGCELARRVKGDSELSGLSTGKMELPWQKVETGGDWELSGGHVIITTPEVTMPSWENPK